MLLPTYSSDEVRLMLLDLDYKGLVILGEVLAEEKELYDPEEFRKLYKAWNYMLNWHIKQRRGE